METLLPVNGIDLCVDTFGEHTDPALLLIAGGASSMDWWDDEFCRRLAAGGRFVIRYDHRDTGRSTSFPAGHPPYSTVDLTNDALGVLDALGVHRAHLVGFCLGGQLAQRIAIERPHRVLSLSLIAATPDDTSTLPHPARVPDWTDRRVAVDRMVDEARRLGGPFTPEVPQLRRLAERVFDRTHDMAATQLNHWCCPAAPSLRSRRPAIDTPTLILHGTLDPLFPQADAETMAEEIPGARLVWLEGVGHEFPPQAVWTQVIDEIIGPAGRRHQPA